MKIIEKLILLTTCLTLMTSCAFSANTADAVNKIARLVEQVKQYSDFNNWQSLENGNQTEIIKKFTQIMDQIAEEAVKDSGYLKSAYDSESSSISSKFVAIALYRFQNKKLFDEIYDLYVNEKLASTVVYIPPDVTALHATEKYRLIWEYFLLSPRNFNDSSKYLDRVESAIGEIRSQQTLISLNFLVISTGRQELDLKRHAEEVEKKQRLAMRILARYENGEALRLILKIAEQANRQKPAMQEFKSHLDLEGDVFKRLTYSPEVLERWKKIITENTLNDLSSVQTVFISRVLAYQSKK